ncbi:helix-turn-helix transcriptional regulator, partial [Escherichia coli]
MFLIITRDTMFFTAMKNILSKGNVVHIQNEEEIDVMGNDSNLLIVFYVQIMPDDFVMQLHR